MKKLYFATVCFLPAVFLVLIPAVFLWHVPFPTGAFPYLEVYFLVGLIVVVVDLWRSEEEPGKKLMWTVLNLFLGLVTLPIYWFVVVRKKPNQPPQTTPVSAPR